MKFKFYGKEFDNKEVDYIKLLVKYNKSSKLYYFVVSNNGHEETILESKTIDDLEIYGEFVKLKKIAKQLGLLEAKSGEFSAFINPMNAKVLKVKNNFFKRKYLHAEYGLTWDDEKIFTTKTERKKSNYWENIVIDFEKYKDQKRKEQKEIEKRNNYLTIKYLDKENSSIKNEKVNKLDEEQKLEEILVCERILKQQKKDRKTQKLIDEYNAGIDDGIEKE